MKKRTQGRVLDSYRCFPLTKAHQALALDQMHRSLGVRKYLGGPEPPTPEEGVQIKFDDGSVYFPWLGVAYAVDDEDLHDEFWKPEDYQLCTWFTPNIAEANEAFDSNIAEANEAFDPKKEVDG
jgi:hypothetical protein